MLIPDVARAELALMAGQNGAIIPRAEFAVRSIVLVDRSCVAVKAPDDRGVWVIDVDPLPKCFAEAQKFGRVDIVENAVVLGEREQVVRRFEVSTKRQNDNVGRSYHVFCAESVHFPVKPGTWHGVFAKQNSSSIPC